MSESRIARSPRELRDELEDLIRDDLIGPIGGPEEELRDPPVDRYLLGLLAPRFGFGPSPPAPPSGGGEDSDDSNAADAPPEGEPAGGGATPDPGGGGAGEGRPPGGHQLLPSAFGLTFAIDDDCRELRVQAAWGAYARHTSEEKLDHDGRPARVWRRRQCGGAHTLSIGSPGPLEPFKPDPDESGVVVQGLVRERNGHRLVSLFFVNGQLSDGGRSVARWLCQASLVVEEPEGRAVFVRRPIDSVALAPAVDRNELAGLEMLYRDSVELAVGHGVGVEATADSDRPDRGVRLQTAAMPAQEVPRTDAPGPEDFVDTAIREPFSATLAALDMQTLSEAGDAELSGLLSPLADAYEAWIAAQERRIGGPAARLAGYEEKARQHLQVARETAARIRDGISALSDPDVAETFRFANH